MSHFRPSRRAFTASGAALLSSPLLAALGGNAAASEAYPNRPIRWIVPYAPGGASDTSARLFGRELEKAFGQNIVVENKPGGSTIIGVQALLAAKADGYTVFSGNDSLTTNIHLMPKVPYKLEDFAGVSVLVKAPLALVSRPDFPASSLPQALSHIQRESGKLSYGSWGVGSTAHLAMETLLDLLGAKMTHAPFNGAAPSVAALASGQLDIMFVDLGSALPFIRSGKVKLWGMGTKERNPLFPDVPAVAEAGLPSFDIFAWTGMVARAGTPKEALDRLAAEVRKIATRPDFAKDQIERGNVAWGSTPQELNELLQRNNRDAAAIIRKRGITGI